MNPAPSVVTRFATCVAAVPALNAVAGLLSLSLFKSTMTFAPAGITAPAALASSEANTTSPVIPKSRALNWYTSLSVAPVIAPLSRASSSRSTTTGPLLPAAARWRWPTVSVATSKSRSSTVLV